MCNSLKTHLMKFHKFLISNMPPNRNNKPLQKWKLFDTNLQYGKSFKKATKKIMDMKYGTGAH